MNTLLMFLTVACMVMSVIAFVAGCITLIVLLWKIGGLMQEISDAHDRMNRK